MGGLQLSGFHCIASAQMAFNTVTVRKLFELVASQRSRACAFGLLLAALTIFVYRPSWNGGFLWDDDDYITHNELLTAPDGLRRGERDGRVEHQVPRLHPADDVGPRPVRRLG